MASPRPPVSVVVPFFGGREEAERAVAALRRLELGPEDEIVVADNTPEQVAAEYAGDAVGHVDATPVRSSYYARNVGAQAAGNDWLLFLDADTQPIPRLVDEYFRAPVGADVGAVAGAVVGATDQPGLVPRYSRSRGHVGQTEDHPHRPMAVTANLLVRRSAWSELGGFLEGIRSGGDADFSWRLQDAGWRLEYAPQASVGHRDRESLKALLRQSARYGAGMRWLQRRHPGARFDGRLRALARCAAGILVWTATFRFERALFKGIDAAWILSEAIGSLSGNAHREPPGAADVVVTADVFPERADPATALTDALQRRGLTVLVAARMRPARPDWQRARGLAVSYAEDDGTAVRLGDLGWVAVTHPVSCARDLLSRGGRHPDAQPLRVLAPVARRIAAAGPSEIQAAGGRAAAIDATRLGALLGIRVDAARPTAEGLGGAPEALGGAAVAVDGDQARDDVP